MARRNWGSDLRRVFELVDGVAVTAKWHREDGPAIKLRDGTRHWLLNGKLHREDGPAVERPEGPPEWWRDGQLHREDGPAIERPDGTLEWWRDGVQYASEVEWLNEMLLRRLAEVVAEPSVRSRPSPLAR